MLIAFTSETLALAGGVTLATKFGQKIDASPILGTAAKGVGNVYGNVAKTAATAVADTAPKLVDQVQKK